MFALVDCNNFFASCERVFNPALREAPIVVLSNNDGCVVARSNEAKRLGIKMGIPAYQIEDDIVRYGINVFSSNYTLYGDMSARVMFTLQRFAPEIEIYSIDEAFMNFSGMERFDLKEYGRQITDTVLRHTGMPVSMGIAETKTLAKVANKFAKKYPGYRNVCLIDSQEKRIKALQLTDIGEVWGIGHRQTAKLKKIGVETAFDFSQLPVSWVRKNMTVTGERILKELLGESCIDLETITPAKKQICTSRSFGSTIADLSGLSEAISNYAAINAQKLREQKSYGVSLMVFIHTNNFREDLPQYFKNCTVHLPVPTNNTVEIVHYALVALRRIFREGYQYKKAGVIITEITSHVQTNLFDRTDREKQKRFMSVVDHLNSGFSQTLKLAVQGGRKWKLKQERLSPCYTTKLTDIIKITGK